MLAKMCEPLKKLPFPTLEVSFHIPLNKINSVKYFDALLDIFCIYHDLVCIFMHICFTKKNMLVKDSFLKIMSEACT